jgi:hypothetical protein
MAAAPAVNFDEEAARGLNAIAAARAAVEDAAGGDWLPPDRLFANENGEVLEDSVPHVFKNAVLAGRYEIRSYIQSGQFGRGKCAFARSGMEGAGKKREGERKKERERDREEQSLAMCYR